MKRLVFFLLFASLALSRGALAACAQLSAADIAQMQQNGTGIGQPTLPVTVLFQQGSVSIDPDLPIGSEITSGESMPIVTNTAVAVCPNGGNLFLSYLTATPSALPNVYQTNVPGVGFQLAYIGTGVNLVFPFTQKVAANATGGVTYSYLAPTSRFGIKLIKTGDIGSNVTVVFGPIAQGTAEDGKTILTFDAGTVNIKVLPSCAVNTSTLNIDFGTFGPRDVSTTSGPTQPVNFTMQCTGPTPPVSITAALAGTPDTDDASLLKNTGAQNLAIRLSEPSSGTVLKPNDPNSTLVHAPGGAMQSPFALDATVLRVGSTTPTTGKIQATATITLSIL
ncbi:fimbrial protein [Paraburkholderia caballeronis]|nr:fimbrial protein [Paraburkholderia caballeronis]